MFDFLAQLFLGEPPLEKGVDVDLVYSDPNLQAFFLLLVILGAMLMVPIVSVLWHRKKHEAAVFLGSVLFFAVTFASVGIFASGFADARYPHLQLNAPQRQALK
jgi:hypothetical protein